jgi:hypothetical protein
MKLYYLTGERLWRDFDDDGKFFLDNLRVLVGAVVSSASVQFKFPFFFFFVLFCSFLYRDVSMSLLLQS